MHYLFKCAIRELLRRKTRTISAVFGYAIAVVVFIVLSNILIYSKMAAGEILKHTGTHFLAIIPGCGEIDCAVRLRDHSEGLEINGVQTVHISEEVVENVKKLPEIKDASLFLSFRMRDTTTKLFITIGGFDPANDYAVRTTCCAAGDVISGRFLTPADTNAVIIHENYALEQEYSVHDTIVLSGFPCNIVGIINPGIRPAQADIYVNLRYAQKIVQKRLRGPSISGHGNALLVETASSLLHDKALAYLKKEGFTLSTYKCYRPAAKVIGINEKSVWLLIMLIVVGVILFALKSQLSSVLERMRDLAILRAVGWSGKNIVLLIMTESVIQALGGWLAGCVISAGLLVGVSFNIIGSNTLMVKTIPVMTYVLLSAGIVICGGLIAGLIPAVYAIRRKPSEVFRTM